MGGNSKLYGKIVPLLGGRAACGGGGKVQFMRVVGTGRVLPGEYSTAVFNLDAVGLYFT